MADLEAGTVSVKFGADLSELTKAFTDTKRQLTTLNSSIEKGVSGSEKSLQSLGTAAVFTGQLLADMAKEGLALAGNLAGLATHVATVDDALGILAMKTGVSVERLDSWSLMAESANLNLETLATSMRTLSTTIDDGSGRLTNAGWALRELGISATALGNDPEKILKAVADRFQTMPDGIEKSRFAMDLFGRAGLDMVASLNEGSAGIERLESRARELGGTLSVLEREVFKKVKAASDENTIAFKGFQQRVAAAFAPSVLDSLKFFTDMWGKLGEWVQWAGLKVEQFEIIMGGLLAKFKIYKDQIFSTSVFSQRAWEDTNKQIAAINEWIGAKVAAAKVAADADAAARRSGEAGPPTAPAAGDGLFGSLRNMIQNAAVMTATNREMEKGRFIVEETTRSVAKLTEGRKAEIVEVLRRNQVSALLGSTIEQQLAQEERGQIILERSIKAYRERYDVQQAAVTVAEAVARQQAELYQTDFLFADKAGAIRRVALEEQIQQQNLATQKELDAYAERGGSYELHQARLTALALDGETKRMNIVRQYPTFWESQLQSLVDSNTFSVSQIVTTWTGGMANAFVKGGNFAKAAWESTQIAILQAALNTGVHLAAQWALRASLELGILSATSAAKLGLKAASAQAEVGLNAVKNGELIAQDTATGITLSGIWTGIGTFAIGVFSTVSAAIKGLFVETLMPAIVEVGTFIMGVLTAIADAMTATVFGIPYAGAILAGVGLIGAAIAAGLGAFAKGGIVTGPTLGLMGEAGSAEAAIPLNERGAAFMQQTMGLTAGSGAGTEQTIIIQLDGRTISRAVANDLPSMLRLKGLPA